MKKKELTEYQKNQIKKRKKYKYIASRIDKMISKYGEETVFFAMRRYMEIKRKEERNAELIKEKEEELRKLKKLK